MSEVRQELKQVRIQIDNNQYAQAKRSLKRIKHPTAKFWLKLLNHVIITTNMITGIAILLAIVAVIAGIAGYAIADNILMDTGEVLNMVALDSMITACARETGWVTSRCKEDMVQYSVEYGDEFVACYSAKRLFSDGDMLDCLIDLF